jgi:hypothetical protein
VISFCGFKLHLNVAVALAEEDAYHDLTLDLLKSGVKTHQC